MEDTSRELPRYVSEDIARSRATLKRFIVNELCNTEGLKTYSENRIRELHPAFHTYIMEHTFGERVNQRIYNILHDIEHNPTCPVCGSKCKFVHFYYGYEEACTPRCRGILSAQRHGSSFNNPAVREKIKQTCLEKYGVDHPFKSEIVRAKSKATWISKYGAGNPSYCKEVVERIKAAQRLTPEQVLGTLPAEFKVLSLPDNVSGKIRFICDRGHDNNMILDNWLRRRRCSKCNINSSAAEKEIAVLLSSYTTVKTNKRNIIPPLELDIFMPEHNLTVEYNGIYWHRHHDKNYHLNKTEQCAAKGIQLLHIFEDEWLDKQDIVRSLLLSKLGIYTDRIYARQCKMGEVDSNTKKCFLDNNHIQGNCINSISLGLYYNAELVTMMTFGKRKISNTLQWELLRYCTKLNTQVVGGASKLFTHFINNYDIDTMVSYVDRRWGGGAFYGKLGFVYSHTTKPNYWYVHKRDLQRHHRVNFQKHKLGSKLESFDPSLTELQNMEANDYFRVYDCGNFVYKWNR